ncbi:MAG: hypothetical protein IT385_22290 [Deltaproteobacteria bacterium]|nr:hypothetical protein [Deltaproteobacteria bacterium]
MSHWLGILVANVEEARGLARRLAGLPRLRAALRTGAVTWSMAQLLARHATPEDEAELVDAAHHATVRAMRRQLEPERAAEPDEAPDRRTIETVVLAAAGRRSGRGRRGGVARTRSRGGWRAVPGGGAGGAGRGALEAAFDGLAAPRVTFEDAPEPLAADGAHPVVTWPTVTSL